jgi:hypothetical protein
MARSLKQGSVALVWALVTEKTGKDITNVTFQISHVPDIGLATQPGAWENPHALSSSPTPSTRRLAKLVTAAVIGGVRTPYRIFAKATDNPEAEIIDCRTYVVLA